MGLDRTGCRGGAPLEPDGALKFFLGEAADRFLAGHIAVESDAEDGGQRLLDEHRDDQDHRPDNDQDRSADTRCGPEGDSGDDEEADCYALSVKGDVLTLTDDAGKARDFRIAPGNAEKL